MSERAHRAPQTASYSSTGPKGDPAHLACGLTSTNASSGPNGTPATTQALVRHQRQFIRRTTTNVNLRRENRLHRANPWSLSAQWPHRPPQRPPPGSGSPVAYGRVTERPAAFLNASDFGIAGRSARTALSVTGMVVLAPEGNVTTMLEFPSGTMPKTRCVPSGWSAPPISPYATAIAGVPQVPYGIIVSASSGSGALAMTAHTPDAPGTTQTEPVDPNETSRTCDRSTPKPLAGSPGSP